MPLALRSAAQDGCTDHETWLVDELPQGIEEIDWTDCRREFHLLIRWAKKPENYLAMLQFACARIAWYNCLFG